jgi:hypothetical protein
VELSTETRLAERYHKNEGYSAANPQWPAFQKSTLETRRGKLAAEGQSELIATSESIADEFTWRQAKKSLPQILSPRTEILMKSILEYARFGHSPVELFHPPNCGLFAASAPGSFPS